MATLKIKVPTFEMEITCSGENETKCSDWITDNALDEIGEEVWQRATILETIPDQPDEIEEEES